jgi:hypothetical protein
VDRKPVFGGACGNNHNNPVGASETILAFLKATLLGGLTNDNQNNKTRTMNRKLIITAFSFLSVCLVAAPDVALAQAKKPNILVIFGDDIGQTNVSAYSFGVMGYKTPNIDRIAKEGMIFTDYYAEQSCTLRGESEKPLHRQDQQGDGGLEVSLTTFRLNTSHNKA